MLIDFVLSEDTYQLYAAKAYQRSVSLSTEEFYADLKSVERLKSDITRWSNDKEDRQLRLIVNKLVIFFNMFGVIPALKLIFWKNRTSEFNINFLMTMTVFLGICPEYPLPISDGFAININKYQTNMELLAALENVFQESRT